MKAWAARVTVELMIDDEVVATRREIRGALVEHVALERRTLRSLAGDCARRGIERIARETKLL